MAQKLDVFLYGSCVARDLQEIASSRFYRRAYIARQSLISATTPPYVFEGRTVLDSAWQHRMVLGDLESNLLMRLAEVGSRTDLVIWDLTDERLGVQPLGDGSFGTITPDSLRSGILEAFKEAGDPILFGSAEHLELWGRGLSRIVAVLDALGLRQRTYVLAPQWADFDAAGEQIDREGDRAAAEWDRAFTPYLQRLARRGITVVPLPEALIRTDSEHKWGRAPYHYVDDAYAHWAREIEAMVTAVGGKRPLHEAPPEPGENSVL